MSMATRVIIVLLLAIVAALPSKAQTTVFANSIFSEVGVTGSSSALGPFDAMGSTIASGGDIVLRYDLPLTGENIAIGFLPTGINVVGVSIGEVIGGVATFSNELGTVTDGSETLNFNLSTQCSALSASGCSLVRVRNANLISGDGLSVDSVSAISNAPEPGMWALMITGFIVLGGRLKYVRSSSGDRLRGPARPVLFGAGAYA